MPLLPRILTPDDTRALQTSLKAGAAETDPVARACGNLSDVDQKAWRQFYDAVITYSSVPVSGLGPNLTVLIISPITGLTMPGGVFGNSSEDFYNTGKKYEKELVEWQKVLADKGCPVAVRYVIPDPPQGSDIFKWGAIAVGAVAAAWVVSEVVPLAATALAELAAARAAKKRLEAKR